MKLKGAVVGVGYLGKFHAQKLKEHPEIELIGVCDFSFAQASKVAEGLSTLAFHEPQELIGKIDFVHVAASTQAHYELAKLFLKNKIPVLVEKPIAATIAQAEELCELSEKYNTQLTVGHIERFNPAFQYLKENTQELSYLEINRLAPFRERGSDVSVLHDLTIHDIDLVNWLFASKIDSYEITGQKIIKPTYDDVSVQLKLENGICVTINNSRVTPQIIRNYRAVCKDRVILTNTATLDVEVLKPTACNPYFTTDKFQINKADALALEVDRFVQCLLGKQKLMITPQEATLALKNVEMFVKRLDEELIH